MTLAGWGMEGGDGGVDVGGGGGGVGAGAAVALSDGALTESDGEGAAYLRRAGLDG